MPSGYFADIPLVTPYMYHSASPRGIYGATRGILLQIPRAKMSSGEIWHKYPEDQFQISQIPRGAAEGYLGDLKLVRGVFVRYPMRRSRVGYRAKLHELPFPRISQNTTRRSRVVFWLIRGNGNECNFDEIGYGKAKCSQGYLLVTPRMKILTHTGYLKII